MEFAQLRSITRSPIIIDGRNLFSPAKMQAVGFAYYSLGRGDATGSAGLGKES